MALFRILKGENQNLPTTSNEGWMYITEDTGDIHLFTSTTNRLHLNANYANKLRDSTDGQTLLNMGDQGQAIYFVNGIPAECRAHVDLETDQEIDGKKSFINQVSVTYDPAGGYALTVDGKTQHTASAHFPTGSYCYEAGKGIEFGTCGRIGGDGTNMGMYTTGSIYLRPSCNFTNGSYANGAILTNASFYPAKTNTTSLGTSTYKWSNLYAMTGTISGNFTVKTLVITDTSSTDHIKFSRGSANYITAPTGGTFNFVTNGKGTTAALSDVIITADMVYPGTTNKVDLGSSANKWKNVYATTFTGAMSQALSVNGKSYNGSEAIDVGTMAVAYGGTGATDQIANRLVWSESANKIRASYHYASSDKVAINSTDAPSENFYVKGKIKFLIPSSSTSAKNFLVGTSDGNNVSIGATGLQAYNTDGASLLYLNYYGGNISVGTSGTIATIYSDLNYNAFSTGTDDVSRVIWFSHSSTKGRPVYDEDFKYNPSTNTLSVINITAAADSTIKSASGKTLTLSSGSTAYLNRGSSSSLIFKLGGTENARFNTSGHFVPGATDTYTIGTSSLKWKNIYATTFTGALVGNADTATKATQDGNGAVISSTYLKLAGGTMTGPITMNAGTGLVMKFSSGADNPLMVLSGYPAYGIRYHEGSPDKMTFSASGNASTPASADLCLNGGGDGVVTIRGNTVLHASNYNNYAPTLTGGGASGTWSISINGNAATATSATTTTYIVTAQGTTNSNRHVFFAYDGDPVSKRRVVYDDSFKYNPSTKILTVGSISGNAKNGVFYVTGNTTGTAGTWTGTNTDIPSLYTGLTIAYKIGIAGASTTTLNLTTAAGASGAKTVKRNDSNLTTHVPVNGVILLTYDGTNWRWADYSTSNNATTQSVTTTSSWRPVLSHYTAGSYGTDPGTATGQVYYNAAIAIQPSTGKLKATAVEGAVWNDYAEYRTAQQEIKPGYCVASMDNGVVVLTTEHLQSCDGIVSDTFGFSIGETQTSTTPLAVSGRVLAYCEGDRYDYHSGDVVAAGPNGRVVKMTREEIKEYPDRIVGIVSEIPEYDTWGSGNVKVNGRIWIKVK